MPPDPGTNRSTAFSNPGHAPKLASILSMSSPFCRFCSHGNPSGAKFCNECGSPLHLRPCPRCEAVTDSSAGRCHQCGAVFDAEPVAVSTDTHLAANESAAMHEREAGSTRNEHERETAGTRNEQHEQKRVDAAERAHETRHDKDLATSQFTQGDAYAHIPEWLAERFDAANTRQAVTDEPFVPDLPRESETPPRRAHSWLLIIAGAVAVGLVGYYGYFVTTLHGPASSRGVVEPSASREASAPNSEAAKPQPAAPAQTAAPAPKPAPQAPASDVNQAKTPRKNVPGATPSDPKTGAAQEALHPTTPRTASEAANATQRLVERDMGRSAARSAHATPVDRDAIETKRLIERDLGAFLPRPARRN